MNEEEVKELIAIYEDKERYNTAKRLGKMWHSYRQLQNNWNELKDNIKEVLNMVCTIEHNLEKYEEVGLDHFDYALKKTGELKSYVMEILEGNNE